MNVSLGVYKYCKLRRALRLMFMYAYTVYIIDNKAVGKYTRKRKPVFPRKFLKPVFTNCITFCNQNIFFVPLVKLSQYHYPAAF